MRMHDSHKTQTDPVRETPQKKRKILLIATGGTIASKPTESGLQPGISSAELLECVPEASEIGDITAEQLMNLDSTNMDDRHWRAIAAEIEAQYNQYDGFVITHGTDTMAYTAAALSYLIQQSPKPIVMTGSQQSIYARDTDARRNLLDALRYAAFPGAHGVSVVFDGKAMIGTRVRKVRTHSYNAFSSVDYPDLAILMPQRIIPYIEPEYGPAPLFFHRMNSRVFTLRLIPGFRAADLSVIARHFDALILEGFGMGGIPTEDGGALLKAIRQYSDSGHLLVLTTQVPHEGSDLSIYQVGVQVRREVPVIEANDMTLEAIVAKMMWALAEGKDSAEVRKLFCAPVARDIL